MATTPSLVGQTLGNYRVVSLIGTGGMGYVYRARDERLKRDVAIKIIHPAHCTDPDAVARFEHEARALAALNHPNLLAIYDVGTQDGSPFIVSELLEGETLRTRLTRGRLSYPRTIECAIQIVRALVAAHEKAIVHRDVKPENIFLTTDGQTKILDLGLAKLIESDHTGDTTVDTDVMLQTDFGRVMGTVAYMSPEQLRGERVDHRTDIFSFGSMLFEMLTQRRAFGGQTSADVMTAILKEEPQSPSEIDLQIPAAASLVVQHCIEKRREDRFQSAKDLLFDLTLLSKDLHSSGAITISAQSRPSVRRGIWAGLACIILGAAIGALISHLRPSKVSLPSYAQLTFQRGNISSARFTTDGNTVIYTASWNGAPSDIFFIRPGTTQSRSLGLINVDLLSVSSTGELAVLLREANSDAWFDRGTLARVPVTGGTPREIVEDIQTADWSPDGSSLAVGRKVKDRERLEFPIGKVLFETAGWLTDVRISPHGDTIAFMEHPSPRDDRGWVSLVDVNGKTRRLTEEFASERGLAWTPRGDEVWFTATRSGEPRELFSVSSNRAVRLQARVPTSLTVYDISRDGTVLLSSSKGTTPIVGFAPGDKAERDLSSLDQTGLIDLSNDGRFFLFQYYGEGSGSTYASYLGRTDGSPPVRLGTGSALALSPDDRWALTYDDKLHETLLVPIGAGEARALERPGFTDTTDDSWCPDQTCVVFTGQQAGKPPRSYIQNVGGGRPVPFGPDGVTNPIISPDGKLVLGRSGEKYVMFDRDGRNLRDVHGLRPDDRVLRWADKRPDLYVYQAQRKLQLFELRPDTGQRQMLREIPVPGLAVISGAPHLFVSQDGKSYVYSVDTTTSELYLVKNLVY